MGTKEDFIAAFKDGIAEKVKSLAQMEAANEITEAADVASAQCARGLRLAADALERGLAEIEKIFPE